MLDRIALILLDAKANRHSMNALLAAIETDRELDALDLRRAASDTELASHLKETFAAGRRPIVGISFTTPQLWAAGDMMSRFATRVSGATWIAGGPHPTADPEGTLQLGFDIAVRGEGEATLLDLIKVIAAERDLSTVAGIAYRDPSGRVRTTPRRAPIDLDAFGPLPLRRRRMGPIEITRGCPFACGFCQTSHLLGARPRHRSIETIARYAAEIRRKGACDVRLITPNAYAYGSVDGRTLNLPVLESLLAALRGVLGSEGRLYFGTFPSEVRPEHVNETTLELTRRYANNDYLVIGAQSGSQHVLEQCGRGHTVADVFLAVSRTLTAGLKPHVDFIFGLPGETDTDVEETIAAIRELAAMGALIHAHTFMPLPQTRFADAPPGQIHRRVRAALKDLINQGVLYGVWHRQERDASRFSEHLRDRRG